MRLGPLLMWALAIRITAFGHKLRGEAVSSRGLRMVASKLKAFQHTTDQVYGASTSKQHSWKPKRFGGEKGRYLWTDAFGVCNYVTLACETGDPAYLGQADALITEVHETLGRDRGGHQRLGSATKQEPTRGGLRIGKLHGEGHPDGDDQYFHYLTKWAFALNQMSLATRRPVYNDWAVQLMEAAHPHFVIGSGMDHPRMFWKITIDMQRPLVSSEGNLDPFDGLVTYRILQEASGSRDMLQNEIQDMERMVMNECQRKTVVWNWKVDKAN